MKSTLLLVASLAVSTAALGAVEVQFTAGARSLAQRKLLVEPATVQFHRGFLDEMATGRGRVQRMSRAEVDRLAAEMGETFQKALAEALKARGFEVVATPGADVLRVSPSLQDLYVYAPEGSAAGGVVKQYVREAGSAAMRVEVRDAGGAPIAVASDRATTGRIEPFSRASDVSNRFWFDAMFRRSAEEMAVALAGK